MRNLFLNIATLATLFAITAGCGTGTDTPAPKTQAASTVYLFGTMSSTSRVATIHSETIVPEGIMVNYSSPPGATTGKYPLRSGSIVPSGPVKIAPADVSAEFNLADRKLTIDYINNPDFTTLTRKNVKSGTTGNGIEIATIYFKLKAPDALPVMPAQWQDLSVVVGEETSSLSVIYATGLQLNLVTTFIP